MGWNYDIKDDFVATDGLTHTHVNEMAENIQHLFGQGAPTGLAIANSYPIGTENTLFYTQSGATYIDRLQFTDGVDTRPYGNIIWIVFAVPTTINRGSSISGNYKGIDMTNPSVAAATSSVYGFIHMPTYWFMLAP